MSQESSHARNSQAPTLELIKMCQIIKNHWLISTVASILYVMSLLKLL